ASDSKSCAPGTRGQRGGPRYPPRPSECPQRRRGNRQRVGCCVARERKVIKKRTRLSPRPPINDVGCTITRRGCSDSEFYRSSRSARRRSSSLARLLSTE